MSVDLTENGRNRGRNQDSNQGLTWKNQDHGRPIYQITKRGGIYPPKRGINSPNQIRMYGLHYVKPYLQRGEMHWKFQAINRKQYERNTLSINQVGTSTPPPEPPKISSNKIKVAFQTNTLNNVQMQAFFNHTKLERNVQHICTIAVNPEIMVFQTGRHKNDRSL